MRTSAPLSTSLSLSLTHTHTPSLSIYPSQTVMTSVYGVTKVGARAQIQARLQERLLTDPSKMPSPEMERELFGASS